MVPSAAVGADGIPVNVGDAIVALKEIALAFAVILEVFEAIAFVFDVILEVLAAIDTILAVILAVLDVTLVSNAVMSFVFVVIFAALIPILFVFVAILAAFVAIAEVFAVILEVFEVILVLNVASAFVALVISDVILDVLDAILDSAVVTLVGIFEIVDELTPPTLFTVGKSAVPPKSLVNLILPFTLDVASGVAEAAIPEATPAVKAD